MRNFRLPKTVLQNRIDKKAMFELNELLNAYRDFVNTSIENNSFDSQKHLFFVNRISKYNGFFLDEFRELKNMYQDANPKVEALPPIDEPLPTNKKSMINFY